MEQELLVTQLSEIAQTVQNNKKQTEVEFEKLQVALTGVLRLLAGEKSSPLIRMQGTPQDVKGYIIRLVSELHVNIVNRWETLSAKLEFVLKTIRNS
jgi:hypothetical protein